MPITKGKVCEELGTNSHVGVGNPNSGPPASKASIFHEVTSPVTLPFCHCCWDRPRTHCASENLYYWSPASQVLGWEASTTTPGFAAHAPRASAPTAVHPLAPVKAAKYANTDLLPLGHNWQLCVSLTRCQFSSEMNIAAAKCKLEFRLGVESLKSKQPFVSKLTQITGCSPDRRKQLFEWIVQEKGCSGVPAAASEPRLLCPSVFLPSRLPLNGTNVLWLSDETTRSPEWHSCLPCQLLLRLTMHKRGMHCKWESHRNEDNKQLDLNMSFQLGTLFKNSSSELKDNCVFLSRPGNPLSYKRLTLSRHSLAGAFNWEDRGLH